MQSRKWVNGFFILFFCFFGLGAAPCVHCRNFQAHPRTLPLTEKAPSTLDRRFPLCRICLGSLILCYNDVDDFKAYFSFDEKIVTSHVKVVTSLSELAPEDSSENSFSILITVSAELFKALEEKDKRYAYADVVVITDEIISAKELEQDCLRARVASPQAPYVNRKLYHLMRTLRPAQDTVIFYQNKFLTKTAPLNLGTCQSIDVCYLVPFPGSSYPIMSKFPCYHGSLPLNLPFRYEA